MPQKIRDIEEKAREHIDIVPTVQPPCVWNKWRGESMGEGKGGCKQKILSQDMSHPMDKMADLKEDIIVDYQRSKRIPTGKY